MIPVSKPFIPPIQQVYKHLKDIWDSALLTNNGPRLQKLESKLKKSLNTYDVVCVNNGTIALQLAIKALNLKGEIITTPFSYIATTSSLVWEGCTPVFVDIEEDTFNINAKLIERSITSKTTAIMATHVFGNPCEIDSIDKIAKKHNLKVIYDGAHAFGVKYKENSIFNYGDVTTCSTHATKLFHTVEGGFIVSKDKKIIRKISYMRNFGHDGPYDYAEIGINGKNSELHAAVGLVNLEFINNIILKRKKLSEQYSNSFKLNQNNKIFRVINSPNYSYYPILFKNENDLLELNKKLQKNNIQARRYFKPSLNELRYLTNNDKCEISESISNKILCLPLYDSLKKNEVELICNLICKK